MDRIDTEEDSLYGENDQTGDPEKLRKIIEELQKKKQNKQEQLDLLESQGISQQSLTDPDAKLLQKRHTKAVVGYNIQTAVDSKYHLIVAYDITNRANDKQCLYPMINKIKEVTGHDPGNVVADSGYYNGVHIHNADKRGVKTYIPIINTSSSKHNGRYDKTDFTYLAEEDAYRCPAGKLLELSGRKGTDYKPGVYRTKKCKNCKKRHLCTTNKNGRTINRYAHEESLIGLRERNINNPEIQRSRKTLVEHPFGTLKENWGYGRFLVKGNEKVRGEMGLMLLAYNLKRVMNAGKSQKVETSSKR